MSISSRNLRLDPLADLFRGFVRRPGVRAFAVEAALDDQPEVARMLAGFEHHADNRSPFLSVTLRDSTCASSAWSEVLRGLQDSHAELRSAGAPVGSMPPLPVGDEAAAKVSVALVGIASSVGAPARGVLVLLVLGGHVDPEMLEQLGTMVRSRELEEVRFVVLAGPGAKLDSWASKHGEARVRFYRLDVPGDTQASSTIRALDSEERLGPGFRGAWPMGTKPPPRPRRRRAPGGTSTGAAPPPRAETDAPETDAPETGAQPEAENAAFEHSLSVLIRRAEAEMQQERGPEALRLQSQARELCTEHEQHVRAIEMEMMLGGYLLRLGQPRLAASTFARADEASFAHQAYEHAAKAQLNRGIAHEADGDTVAALRAYRRAIDTGKGVADAPSVVFEAYRRAGEVALREDLEVDCIGLWADAVVYGRDLPKESRGESLRDLAKRLSQLLVRHRRYSQAREIDRLAEDF